MATALKDYENGVYMTNFTGNQQRWEVILRVLSNKITEERGDSPLPPAEIAEIISSTYCKKDITYGMREGGIINDKYEISTALRAHNPWLNCGIAESESIFVVAIDDGSPNLNELSYPNRDLFVRMTDFSTTEVDYLKNKITLTLCDCEPTSDGRLPLGCTSTNSEPSNPPSSTTTTPPSSTPTTPPSTTTTTPPSTTTSTPPSTTTTTPPSTTTTTRPSTPTPTPSLPAITTVIQSVTDNWGLDEKEGKLQLVAVYPLDDGKMVFPDFTAKRADWMYLLKNLSSVSEDEDGLVEPINDEAGIKRALRRLFPWLRCELAAGGAGFMVAVDGGWLF
ncbi:unnamed protein product [Anisakis simplex]|uniref:Uncharacterized protein n=1 Tax=Anisakis simplex TaxID=6269 RepID=A0A0M3K9L1_ANISI|nr:unnamed protein product [Anisakis simplex]